VLAPLAALGCGVAAAAASRRAVSAGAAPQRVMLAVVVAAALGVAVSAFAAPEAALAERALRAASVAGLVYIGLVDLWARLVPTLPTLAVGLAGLALAVPGVATPLEVLVWPVAAWVALTAFARLARRWRGREVLGPGDADLTAALACWAGSGAPLLFALAVGASVIASRALSPSATTAPLGLWLAVAGVSSLAGGVGL